MKKAYVLCGVARSNDALVICDLYNSKQKARDDAKIINAQRPGEYKRFELWLLRIDYDTALEKQCNGEHLLSYEAFNGVTRVL